MHRLDYETFEGTKHPTKNGIRTLLIEDVSDGGFEDIVRCVNIVAA